ncbi:hypothetical protein IMSAG049_01131 [Clostridiales bacterium]|nr:hypothetical protein IMSAG049_01131 [Clostridiales bacterium]
MKITFEGNVKEIAGLICELKGQQPILKLQSQHSSEEDRRQLAEIIREISQTGNQMPLPDQEKRTTSE